MSDAVSRFLFEELDIRGAVVRLGPTWHEMTAQRDYAAPVECLLGELAAAAALIGSNLKLPGRLTFQLQGHGPVRMLVMDCDEQLRLRGLAKADQEIAAASARQLLGDGRLVLSLQTNVAAERPYQSQVPLEGDTVAAIFEHYLERSEQTPTRLWLTAEDGYAAGLFLQKLPAADARDADGWNRIIHLAATLRAEELRLPAASLLHRLFPEETIRLFDSQAVRYHCPRDEGKILDMLRTLGREEVADILDQQDEIVIQDDICHHEYRYGREVLAQLFPSPSRNVH